MGRHALTKATIERYFDAFNRMDIAAMPEARGQGYRLPAGSLFSLVGAKITRVLTYYNRNDWIRQVS